jgi:hypothetical protein
MQIFQNIFIKNISGKLNNIFIKNISGKLNKVEVYACSSNPEHLK